ncbi:PREDICTED: cuticle collagen 13-like, partial [Chinchilla lanigera]|uniref:cuticle collagen 13-like n=1 Tax=Chinchilla lanigera TaxID=34839 RepID=UPI000695C61F
APPRKARLPPRAGDFPPSLPALPQPAAAPGCPGAAGGAARARGPCPVGTASRLAARWRPSFRRTGSPGGEAGVAVWPQEQRSPGGAKVLRGERPVSSPPGPGPRAPAPRVWMRGASLRRLRAAAAVAASSVASEQGAAARSALPPRRGRGQLRPTEGRVLMARPHLRESEARALAVGTLATSCRLVAPHHTRKHPWPTGVAPSSWGLLA